MRLTSLSTFLAVAVLLSAPLAWGYEGAGIEREEPAEVEPAAPQLTRAPSVARFVEAEYPPQLLAEGQGGDVVLLVDIDAEGRVPAAEVSVSSGVSELDEAARRALLEFEFVPAEFDGVPAPVRLEYLYRFEPRPAPVPEPAADASLAPVNLRGRVLKRGTREPLAGAVVHLPQSGAVAETDEEGRYEIRGAPEGKTLVEITASGHRRFSTSEEIRQGDVTELVAYLWPSFEGAFEVTVRGERDKKEVSRRTLQREELTSVPGTMGDPIRVIQNMPGMARAPYASGALLVRGAQPEDTSVLIDGVRVPLLYHFGGGPSVLNPSFIDRIDFFPGAYGAKYGRAIAGVVDVATRSADAKRLHGSFTIDLLNASAFIEGPVGGDAKYGHFAVGGRRSYIDLFLPTILEMARTPGQASIVAAPRYWDYQARYNVELGGHRLEAMAFGSDDVLNVAQAGSSETQDFSLNSHEGFHRLRLKWSRRIGEWNAFVAPYAGTSVRAFNFADQLSAELSTRDFGLRGGVAREIGERLSVETGVELSGGRYEAALFVPQMPKYQPFPGEHPQLPAERRSVLAWGSSWAAYAEAVWRPFGGLKLVPGIRAEIYALPEQTVPTLQPRLAARYEFSENTALKAAWGLFRQSPQPIELDADFGNPFLGLPRSSQTVVGFEQKLLPRLTLDLQGFYNWRTWLVVASQAKVQRGAAVVNENLSNAGRGYAYGLEALLKHDLTERMYGWIAYTLSRSVEYDFRRKGYFPVNFDQTHMLTMVGSYKLPGGWELGARFRLTTGRPATPVAGSWFDADTNTWRAIYGERGSARGALFHQLDLRAEKLFTFQTWRLSTYLDVQNVYNAENPEFDLYDYRWKEKASLRGLPILPTLGVTGTF